MRFTVLFCLLLTTTTAACQVDDDLADIDGGGGGQEPTATSSASLATAKIVQGLWLHPESTTWSAYHQRWLVTNTAVTAAALGFSWYDGGAWLGQISPTGEALFPDDAGGMSTIANWDHLDMSTEGQWGGGSDLAHPYGFLANPLGITSNPITGMIYVVEPGKTNAAGDPDMTTAGAPSITVLTATGKFAHRIRLPGVVTINDVVWVQTPLATPGSGRLYVTDSGFGGTAKIVQIANPDSPSAVGTDWLALTTAPGANAIALDPNYDSGGGARPHLVISTLGTDLTGVHANGKLISVDLTSKVVKTRTMTGAGAPTSLFSDGIAIGYPAGVFATPAWYVGDLRLRKIYKVNRTTGDTTVYADLASLTPQIGGMSCAPRTGTEASRCTVTSFGWSSMIWMQ